MILAHSCRRSVQVGIIPIENAPGLISAIATKRRSRLQIVAYTFLWFKWYISNGRVSIGVDGKGSGQRELTCCAKDDCWKYYWGSVGDDLRRSKQTHYGRPSNKYADCLSLINTLGRYCAG